MLLNGLRGRMTPEHCTAVTLPGADKSEDVLMDVLGNLLGMPIQVDISPHTW